ncbi:hypothetical protein MJ561_09840 [Klebsiella pneumoniae]|nr:hypothetical protein MJ561_09840 [Klebsiella pneumoniae]
MSDAQPSAVVRHAADECRFGYKQRLALACSLMHEPRYSISMNPPPASTPHPPRVLAT